MKNNTFKVEETFMDKVIVSGLFIGVALISIFFLYGMFAAFWSIPDKNAQIRHLQTKTDAYRAEADELKGEIERYQVAMKFENLFLLGASPNQIMDFERLEKYIKDKKTFYTGSFNKP